MPKTIVDAKADSKGNIASVRFQGNSSFTPLETAIRMADRGDVTNAHVVRPSAGNPYLRSNPDRNVGNNLDHLAGDT
jgi:hypothetical protein